MSDLTKVHDEVVVCQRCRLSRLRLKAVPGEGPEDARILFIGEAPGWHENEQGRPFVGPAGQLLESLLASIGLTRDQVFITNIVKCRPPENREPLPDEIEACAGYLERQIAALQPKLIVTLGRFSMAKFFPNDTISKIHGKPRKKDGVIYLPLYHPAAALRQQKYKAELEADFQKIPALLAEADQQEESEPSAPEEPPQQLSLF